MGKYYSRLQSVVDAQTFLFGSLVWLESENENVLSDWLASFTERVNADSIAEAMISSQERGELLAAVRPAGVSDGDVNQFIDRWNRTIGYWEHGIFNSNDVQQGQSLDFLSIETLSGKLQAADQAVARPTQQPLGNRGVAITIVDRDPPTFVLAHPLGNACKHTAAEGGRRFHDDAHIAVRGSRRRRGSVIVPCHGIACF
jgi:hypothetical protein